MKYLKYPLSLISPVLAYYAYIGNSGAANLLFGWTVFGVVASIIIALIIIAAILIFLALPKNEELKKLNNIKPDFEKVKGFTFATVVNIGCIVFYTWCGWWWLALMEAAQLLILKASIFFYLQTNFNEEH